VATQFRHLTCPRCYEDNLSRFGPIQLQVVVMGPVLYVAVSMAHYSTLVSGTEVSSAYLSMEMPGVTEWWLEVMAT